MRSSCTIDIGYRLVDQQGNKPPLANPAIWNYDSLRSGIMILF